MVKIKIGSIGDLRPGESKVVETDSGIIALFNVEGKFFATPNACLHKGGSLGDGFLSGSIVTCPLHGWEFDVTTGENLTNPSRPTKSYNVIVEGSELFLEI
ncbi:MAG: Rieske (2Fe-2S) protein [Candidatus Aenigmarchaeota archaeon]|nr:Rieske (2Fe-2S) protein [Candidatus Aenigmarchaeota archaeon]